MANDCLVTKLKGVVNNDSLPILGTIKMNGIQSTDPINTNKIMQPSLKSGKSVVFESIDGYLQTTYGDASTNTNHLDVSSPINIYTENKAMKIRIKDKYNLTGLYFGFDIGFELSEFSESLDVISINAAVNFNSDVYNTVVSGDIKNLSKLVNLTYLRFAKCPNVIGNLEYLIEGLYANGKSSGEIGLNLALSGVKIHNNDILYAFNNIKAVFTQGLVSIVDINTPSTVYATYNGSTWTYSGV